MSRAERLALIDRHDPALPVTRQCGLMTVSRSSSTGRRHRPATRIWRSWRSSIGSIWLGLIMARAAWRRGWQPRATRSTASDLRWTPIVGQPEPCNPADFDVGPDRGCRDASTLYLVNIKFFAGCGVCGYVGEGEHFPAFRACSGSGGSGGSGAGRQRRASPYPQALLVNLARRAITEALMLALVVVEAEPGANAGPGFGDRRICIEIDLLIFQAAP